MKRIIQVWVLALLGTACSGSPGDANGPLVETENEPLYAATWDEYRANARSLGNGSYLAEWDLIFPNEDTLERHFAQEYARQQQKLVVIRQGATGYEPTFGFPAQTNLRYCVADTFGANKATAVTILSNGATSWQDVANVHFVYDSAQDGACSETNPAVDFAVIPATNPNFSGCAANKLMWDAALPAWGCSVTTSSPLRKGVLMLNTGVVLAAGVTWNGVARHELGHILGFRHEHPWKPGGSTCLEPQSSGGAPDLSGRQLTAYDQTSVMHYPQCGGIDGSNYNISALDGEGARQIYGTPVAWYQTFQAG